MFITKITRITLNPNIRAELDYWNKLGSEWKKENNSTVAWVAEKSETYRIDLRGNRS